MGGHFPGFQWSWRTRFIIADTPLIQYSAIPQMLIGAKMPLMCLRIHIMETNLKKNKLHA